MSNTPRKYRLLKDTPDVKAGKIYTKLPGTYKYSWLPCDGGGISHDFNDHDVENNPEWFEEVAEQLVPVKITNLKRYEAFNENNKQTYRYGFDTDQPIDSKLEGLVRVMEGELNGNEGKYIINVTDVGTKVQIGELPIYRMVTSVDFPNDIIRLSNGDMLSIKKYLDMIETGELKVVQLYKSKSPATAATDDKGEERIWKGRDKPNRNDYPPQSPHDLEWGGVSQKYHDDMALWEHYNPFSKSDDKKEWEIVAYSGRLGIPCYVKNLRRDAYWSDSTCVKSYIEIRDLNSPDVKIHSVRRTSDGEVFTLGDEVQFRSGGSDTWGEFWHGKIISITPARMNKSQLEFEIYEDGEMESAVHKFIANIRHKKSAAPVQEGPRLPTLGELEYAEKVVDRIYKELKYKKLLTPHHRMIIHNEMNLITEAIKQAKLRAGDPMLPPEGLNLAALEKMGDRDGATFQQLWVKYKKFLKNENIK